MKSVMNLAFVALLAVGLTGCGADRNKKGGVNESGLQADGTCSENFLADRDAVNDAITSRNVEKTVKECDHILGKYGTNFSCVEKKGNAAAVPATSQIVGTCAAAKIQSSLKTKTK